MELWIRSQEKNIFEKVNKLYVSTYNEEEGYGIYDLIADDIDDCDTPLGFYKTRERALEVLDEIHQRLINLQYIEITGADYISNQMKKNGIDCVYEMPKE